MSGVEVFTILAFSAASRSIVDKVTKIFDGLVKYVDDTYLFQMYVRTWAPPFDNSSFDAALILATLVILSWTIFVFIRNVIYHMRVKAKQAQIRDERAEYFSYLRGCEPGPQMSFAEWRTMKNTGDCGMDKDDDFETEELDDDSESGIIKFSDFKDMPRIKKADRKEKQIESSNDMTHDSTRDADECGEVNDIESSDEIHTICDIDESEEISAENGSLDDAENSVNSENLIPKEIEKSIETPSTEDFKPVDVSKLLDEKMKAAAEENMIDADNNAFSSLIGNIRARQKQDAMAKEIEKAANEATKQNLERLKKDMECAISENRADADKKIKETSDDVRISNAQKRAIREREKEENKMKKRGKRCLLPDLQRI